MEMTREHELHKRRFGRNLGVLVVLIAFVVLVFGLTIAKISRGDRMEAFDHTPRQSIVPAERPAAAEVGQ